MNCSTCGTHLMNRPFCGVCGTVADATPRGLDREPTTQPLQLGFASMLHPAAGIDTRQGGLPQMMLIGEAEPAHPPSRKLWVAIGIVTIVMLAGAGIGGWLALRDNAPTDPLDVMAYRDQPVAAPALQLTDLFPGKGADEIEGAHVRVVSIDEDQYIVSAAIPVDADSQSPVYQPRVAAVSRISGEVLWAIEGEQLAPRDLLDVFSFQCLELDDEQSVLCGATDYGSARRSQLSIIDPDQGSATSMQVQGGFDDNFTLIGGGVVLSRPGEGEDYELALVDPRTGTDIWAVEATPGAYGSPPTGIRFGEYLAVSESNGEDADTEITTLRKVETGEVVLTVNGWVGGSGWSGDASLILEQGYYDEDDYSWHGFSRLDTTGTVLWSEEDLDLAGAGDGDDPVFALTQADGQNADRELVALDPQDAHELWRYGVGADEFGGWVWDVEGDTLIYSDYSANRVLLLNKTTGTKIASPDGYIVGSGEGIGYFLDDDELTAYDLASGENLWRAENTTIVPSIDDESASVDAVEGHLVLSDNDEIRILLPAG